MMSNSNNIEQFIRANRADFDTAEPDQQVWARIEKTLQRLHHSSPLEQTIAFYRPLFDQAAPAEKLWGQIEKSLPETGSTALESFIRHHRNEFDTQLPGDQVWSSIEQALPARPAKVVQLPWQRYLTRIAAAIVILIAGVNIGIWYAGSSQPGMSLSEVSPEYAELEQFYQRDISAKQNKLASFASYQGKAVRDDLKQMDQMMNELREELSNVPPANREQVVRAMIENYKAKAAILERVLRYLEQQQQTQQPAPTNSSKHEIRNI